MCRTGIIGQRLHAQTDQTLAYMTAEPVQGTAVRVAGPAELAEVRWVTLAEADDLLPGMFGPVRAHLAQTDR